MRVSSAKSGPMSSPNRRYSSGGTLMSARYRSPTKARASGVSNPVHPLWGADEFDAHVGPAIAQMTGGHHPAAAVVARAAQHDDFAVGQSPVQYTPREFGQISARILHHLN